MSDRRTLVAVLPPSEVLEEMRIMQEAASAAAAESKARGLPEVHWRDGQVVYVLPDGTETTEMPESLQLTEAERGQV